MFAKLRTAALILFLALGVWLAVREPLPGAGLPQLWNCAGSRALFCIQK